MTTVEALALRKGDTIRVRRGHRKVARRAMVTAAPTQVSRWVLVPIAYLKHAADNSYSGRDTVAQVPTDEVTRV